MNSYQLYFKFIDEWKLAFTIVADEPIPYTIYAGNINDAIAKAIMQINGISLDGSHKLVCIETSECKVF